MIKVSQQNFKPNKFQWATNNRNYSTLLKKNKEKKKGLIAVILWQLRESTGLLQTEACLGLARIFSRLWIGYRYFSMSFVILLGAKASWNVYFS